MISETIKAVREAEEQAEKIVSDAHLMHDELIEKAREEAAEKRTASFKKIQEEADAKLKEAAEVNARSLEAAKVLQREDIAKMKNRAFSKKDQIIRAVVDKIIS